MERLYRQTRKSRARSPAKLRSDKSVKTFQRKRPIRQRREEEGGAALKSATADIGGIAPLCNAACLMKGLR
jgi:hypothetical protein